VSETNEISKAEKTQRIVFQSNNNKRERRINFYLFITEPAWERAQNGILQLACRQSVPNCYELYIHTPQLICAQLKIFL